MHVRNLFPIINPPSLPQELCWGWIHLREQKEKAEPTSPVAFTSQGWRRAQATGSSGTHAGPLSPSRSVLGRTLSVSLCDGTSACGENNSHISTACSWGANYGSKGTPTSLRACPLGKGDHWDLCPDLRGRKSIPDPSWPVSLWSSNTPCGISIKDCTPACWEIALWWGRQTKRLLQPQEHRVRGTTTSWPGELWDQRRAPSPGPEKANHLKDKSQLTTSVRAMRRGSISRGGSRGTEVR